MVGAGGALGTTCIDFLAIDAESKHGWAAKDRTSIREISWLTGIDGEGIASAATSADTGSRAVGITIAREALEAIALDAIAGDWVGCEAVFEASTQVEFSCHRDASTVRAHTAAGRDGA